MSSPKLCVRCGFDDDLTAQITQVKNRIRGQPRRSIPRLTRVLGPRLDHEAVRRLPREQPSPAQLARRGEKRLSSELSKLAPRMHQRLAADIMPPPLLTRMAVPGTASASLVLPRLCAQLQALQTQRAEICSEIEQRVAAHPRCPIPTGQTCVGPTPPGCAGRGQRSQDCRPPLIRAGDGTSPRRPIWPPMPPWLR